MDEGRYFTARQAADELEVSLSTLYAYVSRGLVRSEATGERTRARRYRAEDVRRLKEGKNRHRESGRSAEGALDWGDPVMESAITLIAGGRLYYRGRDAVALSEDRSLEQVADLVWKGHPGKDASADPAPESDASAFRDPRRTKVPDEHAGGLAPVEAFCVALQLAAAEDPAAYDLRPAAVARTGALVLRLLARAAVGGRSEGAGVARTLQSGWVPGDPRAAGLIDAALILCVDHELNVSSFTARCAASAGATPYAVVTAGLSALGGFKHGGSTERVEAFLEEVADASRARGAISGRLRRGEPVPGFGHPLYPGGDPRGKALLDAVTATYPETPAVELVHALTAEADDLLGERPTVDFGLVVLSRALGLPQGAALALFALGRTVGLVGHAIEQYQSDRLIRPRARYVGEHPSEIQGA